LDINEKKAEAFECHTARLYDERLDNRINKRLKNASVQDRVLRINRLHDYHLCMTRQKMERDTLRYEAMKLQK